MSGKKMVDTVLNPLDGSWTGTLQSGALPALVHLVFADGPNGQTLTISAPGATRTVPVQYVDLTADKVVVHITPASDMPAAMTSFTFQQIQSNRVAWVKAPFGGNDIMMFRDQSSSGQAPSGAMQPGSVTVPAQQ